MTITQFTLHINKGYPNFKLKIRLQASIHTYKVTSSLLELLVAAKNYDTVVEGPQV